MDKILKIGGIVFVVALLIYALASLGKDETTQWDKNFDSSSRSPFGLYVFNKEVKNLFKDKFEKTSQPPDIYFIEKKSKPRNIILIKNRLDLDQWSAIVDEVSAGSDLMVFGQNDIPKLVSDSLGFEHYIVSFDDSNILKLTDSKFENSYLNLNKFPGGDAFVAVDGDFRIVGKTVLKNNEQHANFIGKQFGKGHIYLHSEPLFLTNYYMLKSGNLQYVQNVFSYLPERETVWFSEVEKKEQSRSILRFVRANPSLRYAANLLLGGLILFAIFNIKRKQRIIPVATPLKNTSVEFVRSIGNLYLQEGDFHEMMAKKAQHFLYKVRLELLIDTQNLDEDFISKLHLKTGKPVDLIREAVTMLKAAQDPYAQVMREDLVKMNTVLDQILS
jgi:hypothetical protein